MRARGLKRNVYIQSLYTGKSRPVRARGLKRVYSNKSIDADMVAPRAGAWIETSMTDSASQVARCRAPCGRVD